MRLEDLNSRIGVRSDQKVFEWSKRERDDLYGVMLMSDNPILDLTPAWMEFRTQLKCKLAQKTDWAGALT